MRTVMTVRELRRRLKGVPNNARVYFFETDNGYRRFTWISKTKVEKEKPDEEPTFLLMESGTKYQSRDY